MGLALVLRQFESAGKWPRGLLDAEIAMIPKAEGDSTPLAHVQEWFHSWVADSVFSAGKGVSSVDAWYFTTIDIEEVLGMPLLLTLKRFSATLVKVISISLLQMWLNRLRR